MPPDRIADTPAGPLVGLRVVEFGQLIAGPLAGTLLADLGAEVIHVEKPGVGDSHRHTGPAKAGVALWWKIAGRNKRSVTLDTSCIEGQRVAHRLVERADVVIANLRPSTTEKWRLDWPSLHPLNPKLVMLQISGFGLDSSRRDEPGLGKVAEAISGVVHLTGFADGPPVHTGFSHGDSTTALMGAFAVMAALHKRANDPAFDGELIDLALFETLFRLVEWQIVLADQLGTPPQRSGNQLASAPAAVINTYETAGGEWITVTSATLRSVLNVVRMIGLDETRFQTWDEQRERRSEIDEALARWCRQRSTDECLTAIRAAGVTGERIYSADDILTSPLYAERHDIVSIHDAELGDMRMQAVIPRLANSPGAVWRTGPPLGGDNALIYLDWLKMPQTELDDLTSAGVI